ncbi:hypothetical protein [Porphyromonas sp. COT-290 OH3588]|uniref:hypothetical protein n=1 Tax=Porphyromonas sp. COT-290 OH3588 TaxID=1515617 RepID=UPI001363BD12|nr:hypothetical protein [Porphyromonas sp. COT-290 OH3588]
MSLGIERIGSGTINQLGKQYIVTLNLSFDLVQSNLPIARVGNTEETIAQYP